MLKIEEKRLTDSFASRPYKVKLFNSIQEEICNTLDMMDIKPKNGNSHQLYDAIQKLMIESPDQYSFQFESTLRADPVSEWNKQRITQTLDSFELNPLLYSGVSFDYTQMSIINDESPFELDFTQQIRLTYQNRVAQWKAGSNFSNVISNDMKDRSFNTLRVNSDVICEDEFSVSISPSGIISIISPIFCYLKPTKVILSHFKFFRRVL